MNQKPQKPFRVVVIGGGIAGLTMSHCLQRAGIDHIVLEAYSQVAAPVGASIGFWPHGMRILDQLGCGEDILRRSEAMAESHCRMPDGKALSSTTLWDYIQARHGYEFRSMERRLALEIMYDNLPDKSKILSGKKVTHASETQNGVRVTLADGSHEEGDIVVGCDGVRSMVRDKIWEMADKAAPNLISDREKNSMRVEYTCIIGVSTAIPALNSTSDMHVTYGKGRTFQVVTQPDCTCFLIYQKLETPLTGAAALSGTKFTQQDADNEAAKLSSCALTEDVTFGELYKHRIRSQLVNLEEVVFDHWHFGRMVMLGDAAVKVTPNLAFGGNTAIEGAVTLCNSLVKALDASATRPLSQSTLSGVFQEYQEKHKKRVRNIFTASYYYTRMQSWDNVIMRFIAKYIAPWMGDKLVADFTATLVKPGSKLDYVTVPRHAKGTRAFDDELAVS